MNLAASHIGIRNGSLNEIPSYRRSHCMPGPAKSLDLLRKNLQSAINKDIDAVIKKYLEVCKFYHIFYKLLACILAEVLSASYN